MATCSQLGSRLSVDVRLRSGRTGEIAGTYVAEIAAAESVQSVTETLAERLVESARALERREREGAGPAVASVTPMSAQTAEVPSPESVPDPAPIAFDALDSDEPLSIRSDELEATDQEGARTLIFRDHVEVDRGDLQLRADWLKAFYPPGAKQPSLLSARGGVSVAQGDRRAQCDEAEYEQESERIFCRGNTELRDGSDRIRGDRIVFDLAKRSVRVEGDVQIFLYSTHLDANRDADDAEPGTEGATDLLALESDAPLSIHSDRLEAFDRQGRREIMFNGNVEVVRSDVTLRSQQLEAIYSDQQRQPERLVATGDVMVTQGEREARCERAVYFGAEDRVECSGDAELRDGEDRVRGEMIAFDLATETVVVKGRTRLLFHPEQEPTDVAIP